MLLVSKHSTKLEIVILNLYFHYYFTCLKLYIVIVNFYVGTSIVIFNNLSNFIKGDLNIIIIHHIS